MFCLICIMSIIYMICILCITCIFSITLVLFYVENELIIRSAYANPIVN